MAGRPRISITAIRRGGLVALAAIAVLAVGAATARAAYDLFVTESRAGPGDTVHFSISDTAAGDGYVVTVADKEVVNQTDPNGGGVSGKFDMPDLGSSSRTVSIDATVTSSGGTTRSSRTIDYAPPGGTSGSGTTGTQPENALQPAPVISPSPRTHKKKAIQRPPASNPSTPRTPSRAHTKQSPALQQDPTPTRHRARTPSAFGTTPGKTKHSVRSRSRAGARRTTPAAGLGSAGKPTPAGGSSSKPASPAAGGVISGAADVGGGGLPTGLIVLLALFALAGVAAAVFRASRNWRWRPLPTGKAADEARLTALGRAASANAEWQRTIAQRRASRAGRTS